jgi:type IV pilus biogenesis protein CpaD/CtpE
MRCEPVAAALLMLLAGCAQAPLEMGQPSTFGEASKQTLAAQVIDPVPTYDTSVPVSSGDKANKAIERYRTDKVKQPDKVRTSTSTSGSSPTQ